jgi:hypothetical protein
MSSKKVGEIIYVDNATGEILQTVDKVYGRVIESFIMLRTTDGLDWFYPLGKNEKSLILMMHEWSNPQNMRLSLQAWQRDMICEKLQVGRRQISLLLKSLEKQNCIKRLSQNDFICNPEHASKRAVRDWRSIIKEYNSL